MRWIVLKTIGNLFLLEIVVSGEGIHQSGSVFLDSIFFVIDSIIYRQNYGTPMGSPLSPVIADLVVRFRFIHIHA